MHTIFNMTFGLESHKIGIGTTFELEVERIDIVYVIVGNQFSVGGDFETIGIIGRNDIARCIGPRCEVVAEILRS